MANAREIVAAILGCAMLLGAGGYLYVSRVKAPASTQTAEPQAGALSIPSVDAMCKTMGAAAGDALKQCQADENAAGEFVIAWMGLNNFLIDGGISLEQIQALADLDETSPLGAAADPSGGFDPSNPGGDPSQITAGTDPVTGDPLGYLQSPAQLALFCLQMAGDWVTLHDCISENDPSSHLAGTP
jgi:hypothetical protein